MNAPLASVEGSILIELARSEAGACVPTITSSRPFNLPATFVGKQAEAVPTTVGLLFSLCGRAQTAASLGALEAATGVYPSQAALAARAHAVNAETVRELALRNASSITQQMKALVTSSHALGNAAKPAFVLGAQDAPDFSADLPSLALQAPDSTAIADDHGVAMLLPTDLDWANLLPVDASDSGLADVPTVDGLPRMTTGEMPDTDAPFYAYQVGSAGSGIAAVRTARGLLCHGVRVAGGLVTAYRITAPTEWNFHPRGVVAQLLKRLPKDADWPTEARKIVNAIDPCVAAHIHLQESTHA